MEAYINLYYCMVLDTFSVIELRILSSLQIQAIKMLTCSLNAQTTRQ